MGHWHDVDLAGLTPDERVRLDQTLRAERIPATWGGTVLRVDDAYEARLATLVDEIRQAPAPAPGWAPTPPPPPTPPPTAYGTAAAGFAGYGSAPPPTARTNTSAIVSLVCGLVSVLSGCLPTGPVGIYFGIRARKEIRETGEQGDGMAIAGLIVSAIGTLFLVVALFFVVFVVLLGLLGSSSG